jgi:hypothetical protein
MINIKQIFYFIILVLISYIVQIVFINSLTYGSISINIFLLITIFQNWHRPSATSFAHSLLFGFISSMISPTPIYFDIILFITVSLLVQYLSHYKLTNQSWASLLSATFFSFLVYDVFLYIAINQNIFNFFGSWKDGMHISGFLFLQAVMSSLILFIFYIIKVRFEHGQKRLFL